MFNIFLLVHLVAMPALVSSGGYAAFLSAGGDSIVVVGSGGETVFTVDAVPGERLSYPVFSNLKLVFISSSRGLVQQDILTGEQVVICSERTGSPWISSSGDLWYSLDGYLFKNGVSTGVAVSAFHVSVENGIASFTDRNDDLHILYLEGGQERTVQGYRFYSPTVLTGGDVVAPTLTGEIIYLPADGSLIVVGKGEQPCWSYELEGFFFCVSEDDGHSITGADIWFVKPGEEPVKVTFTSGILETGPSCSGDILWFVDEGSGIPGCVSLDDLSF
ncbi:MAG: hypothetical protein KAR40_03210 [Candidatus Sabulitectum sp.]|nr:hypothetical protein [Candidatus Sabulitectum sp.]